MVSNIISSIIFPGHFPTKVSHFLWLKLEKHICTWLLATPSIVLWSVERLRWRKTKWRESMQLEMTSFAEIFRVQYRSKLWDHLHAVKPHLCRTWLPRIHRGGTKTATAAKTKATESRGELDGSASVKIQVTNYFFQSIVKHYLTFHPLQPL